MREEYCYNCGKRTAYEKIYPIDIALQKTWGISDKLTQLFNLREGWLCAYCGANVRAQGLARAILKSKYGYGQESLVNWVKVANKNKLSVCELNSCHKLHDTLRSLKGLTHSEFGTPSEQNIEKLTYLDKEFDLVLHSETLEHVANPRKAMDECRRVIKNDGLILFTTPIVWSRKTRKRATLKDKKIVHYTEPSYHGQRTDDYLVFNEYGYDIDKFTAAKLAYADWRHQNYVFISLKAPTTMGKLVKFKARLFQQVAIHRRGTPE